MKPNERTEPMATETERGAGLAEYGILLLLILVACLIAMQTLGTTISDLYNTITSQF